MDLFLNNVGQTEGEMRSVLHKIPFVYLYTRAHMCVLFKYTKIFLKISRMFVVDGIAYVLAIFSMAHLHFSSAKYLNWCSNLIFILLPVYFSICVRGFCFFAESVGGLVIFNHFHISFHLMPVVEWYLWIITLQKKINIYCKISPLYN